MSEEQLKAFLEKVQSDISLQEKLNAATDAEDLLEIAKQAGFDISTKRAIWQTMSWKVRLEVLNGWHFL